MRHLLDRQRLAETAMQIAVNSEDLIREQLIAQLSEIGVDAVDAELSAKLILREARQVAGNHATLFDAVSAVLKTYARLCDSKDLAALFNLIAQVDFCGFAGEKASDMIEILLRYIGGFVSPDGHVKLAGFEVADLAGRLLSHLDAFSAGNAGPPLCTRSHFVLERTLRLFLGSGGASGWQDDFRDARTGVRMTDCWKLVHVLDDYMYGKVIRLISTVGLGRVPDLLQFYQEDMLSGDVIDQLYAQRDTLAGFAGFRLVVLFADWQESGRPDMVKFVRVGATSEDWRRHLHPPQNGEDKTSKVLPEARETIAKPTTDELHQHLDIAGLLPADLELELVQIIIVHGFLRVGMSSGYIGNRVISPNSLWRACNTRFANVGARKRDFDRHVKRLQRIGLIQRPSTGGISFPSSASTGDRNVDTIISRAMAFKIALSTGGPERLVYGK